MMPHQLRTGQVGDLLTFKLICKSGLYLVGLLKYIYIYTEHADDCSLVRQQEIKKISKSRCLMKAHR